MRKRISGVKKVKIGTDIYGFSYSFEILTKVAEWLIKKDKLRTEGCPIDLTKRGGRRYLINTQPKHKDGDDFKQPKRLSNGLYIETKYSTIDCEEYAYRLLKKCGYREGMLEVTYIEIRSNIY